jgi:spore maturation protein CgeB
MFYTGHPIRGLYPYNIIDQTISRRMGETYNHMKSYMSSPSLDSYYKKMELLSKTKICIAHNVLLPKYEFPNYYSNELTQKHLPWDSHNRMVPQIKSRTFEGALMGCILLVFKDEYKTIEKYFTENVDFIYFENEQDLNNKIDLILANYDAYKHIALNAQTKVRNNYLTKHFIDRVKMDLKIGA